MAQKRMTNPRGHGAELRAVLIAAASEPLLEPQPLGLPSLRSVARRAGVAPSAVYLHFASAESLLDAVIEEQFAQMRMAIDFDSPGRTLIEQAVAYVRWGIENPGGYQLLFESADRLTTQATGDGAGLGWDLIASLDAAIVAAGADPAASATTALRVWTRLHGIVSLRIHKPGTPWPTAAEDEAILVVRDGTTQEHDA